MVSVKKIIAIGSLFTVSYIAFGLQVSKGITSEDQIAIETLEISESCKAPFKDFNDELTCIRKVQMEVQQIGVFKCAERTDNIEPLDYITRNHGCCSGRSRFIEKALRSIGFETRHVFLIRPRGGISASNFLPLGQRTHAASEVLTSRGWMGIDSNQLFVLLDSDNRPYTYRKALGDESLKAKMVPSWFYTGEFDTIYGLYSRNGLAYWPKLPGPEFHFKEMLWNFRS